jgi:hypothetical protein
MISLKIATSPWLRSDCYILLLDTYNMLKITLGRS